MSDTTRKPETTSDPVAEEELLKRHLHERFGVEDPTPEPGPSFRDTVQIIASTTTAPS